MGGKQAEHTPDGNPCSCGLLAQQHMKRPRERSAYQRAYTQGIGTIAIDGEGVTRNGEHIYTYLAAASATKDYGDISNPSGLSSEAILNFLVHLPPKPLKVGYGLGYDKTLWVRDLPDRLIWLLARPEMRMGAKLQAKPVRWGAYLINMVHKRFTVRRGKSVVTIWDFLGFFQRTFVRSLKDWEVGTLDEWARIQNMKDQRGKFADLSAEQVHQYCRDECRLMAGLADKLIAAHREAGLTLKSYYGAGSTASVLLDKYRAREQKAEVPEAMLDPVQRAFFGGRFEVSRIGPIRKGVHQYDIASAYPHAMSVLPCFRHGKWEYGKRIDGEAALVQYRLPGNDLRVSPYASAYGIELASDTSWGPLPFRRQDGNIVYPVSSGGGWVWRDEFLAAQRFDPSIELVSAWVYKTDCECGAPFAGFENEFKKRLEWGKSGRGQVLKLGMNSCYGKRAQRTGARAYRCMVAAGMITSITRARLLDAMATNREAVLSVATDGLVTSEPLPIHCTEKVLGCWEYKAQAAGVFMLRPGFEFSLKLGRGDEGEKEIKARGAGKRVVLEQRQAIIDQWETHPGEPFTLSGRTLFRGMKTAITRSAKGFTRRGYAQWVDTPFIISYAPTPKRPRVTADWQLHTWALDTTDVSAPYDLARTSPMVRALQGMRVQEDEQPDAEGAVEVEA